MPSFGHLQLTSVLRGVRGPTLPAEAVDLLAPVHPAGITDLRAADLRARALSAGAPEQAADALVDAVGELDARERAQVTDPLRPAPGTDVLRLGTAAARQTDGTTCGSSVLAMLAAAGDPTLAYWLVTGRTLAGYRPPELDGAGDAAGPAVRFGDLQEALKGRTNARAVLGLLRWPRALGTPPWGAARVARFPGVTYRSVLVDDTRTGEVAVVLARAGRALDRGVPVPLYAGGDLARRQRARAGGDLEHARRGGRVVARVVEHAAVLRGDRPLLLGGEAIRKRRLCRQRGRRQKTEKPPHDAPTLTVPSAITVPEKTWPLSGLRTFTMSPAEPGSSVTAVAEIVSAPAMK